MKLTPLFDHVDRVEVILIKFPLIKYLSQKKINVSSKASKKVDKKPNNVRSVNKT